MIAYLKCQQTIKKQIINTIYKYKREKDKGEKQMKTANRWGCNTHTHTHTQVNIKKGIKNKNLTILKLGKTNYIRDG